MAERNINKKDGMREASKRMERAWLVFRNPEKHSRQQFQEAEKYLKEQVNNYMTLAKLEKDGDDPQVSHGDLELVMQGLFHHGYAIPLNVHSLDN